MFQEIFRAPFIAQASLDMFRSPDVARLPFVGGSIHAVTTPLWTPTFGPAVFPAPAIAATTAHKTTPAATSSIFDGDFILRPPSLPLPGTDHPLRGTCWRSSRRSHRGALRRVHGY